MKKRLYLAMFTLALLFVGGSSAVATEYPSWEDVASAQQDESAAQSEIVRIQGLIAELKSAAESALADEEAKGFAWREADDKFQEAAQRALNLQDQADRANSLASESSRRAGQMAAQLVRSGGQDLTSILLTSGNRADDLLYYLGLSAKVSEQANQIYEAALQDRNTAQALTDQADVATAELEVLKVESEQVFVQAQAASIAAAKAVEDQAANQSRLQQQLTVLTERRAATEADYQAGVDARKAAGIGLDGGDISASGWALPASGSISDSFGPRIHPVYGGYSFHQGVDIDASCDQNIYAATGGTVVYAGHNGGYGNFVLIDHGGGVATAYAHIVDGGVLVSYGESVAAGQNIARVGTTGTSTGCHLHFEVRISGVATDPVPFMADRGITIG